MPTSHMSREKRCPPSISAAEPKRHHSEENEELMCSICFDLVVDAVQVGCCGALHCRACIVKCTTCPLCREPLRAENLYLDVRRERLSAAALRQCCHAENGCIFKGNRASVIAHEPLCDFVPPGVFRNSIQKLQRELEEALLLNSTNVERMTKLQRTLMNCALGPEPAIQAIRVLHSIHVENSIFAIDRAASAGKLHWVCSWFGAANKNKMKPKAFLDLELFREVLQGGEGYQADAVNQRCFTCGTMGHWAHDCILHTSTINQQLFNAGCCSNCGIPVAAAGTIDPDIQELQVC